MKRCLMLDGVPEGSEVHLTSANLRAVIRKNVEGRSHYDKREKRRR